MKLFKSSALALALACTTHSAPAQAGDNPYLADVMVVAFNFCPRGWAKADGQILPIAQNTALFSLLGTTYGGDGRSTFGLPNLQGRYTIGTGQGAGLPFFQWGQTGGVETVTMTQAQMPSHTHSITALPTADVKASSANPNSNSPNGKSLGTIPAGHPAGQQIYATDQNTTTLMGDQSVDLTVNSVTVDPAGGSAPQNNMQPTLALTTCIAMVGAYPPRS